MTTASINGSGRSTWSPPRVTYTRDGLFRWDGEQWQTVPFNESLLPGAPRAVSAPAAEPERPAPVPHTRRALTRAHVVLLLASTALSTVGVGVSFAGFR